MGGEAKRRGTFEERRQQSIERREAAEREALKKENERWASLTDEEREREKRRRGQVQNFLALAMIMGSYKK